MLPPHRRVFFMGKKKRECDGLFTGDVGRALGLDRNRALGQLAALLAGESQAAVTLEDFKCDAEQVEVDSKGRVGKSMASSVTR
ncbi:hypothetical protein HYW87_03425 [Candidatus Roizmanbacteria bacterium]|nr:hypothetical protein [Candidatus Roizmanbacteria bacterium]